MDTGRRHGVKTGEVVATDNHSFYIPTTNQWVEAGQLKQGMWLRTSAGTHTQITAIKTWAARQRVHTLTVGTDHTYHVLAGTAALLVHNCDGKATVFFDDAEGHVSIAVTHNGRTIHTEAGSVPGRASIPGIRSEAHSPGTTALEIPLPNAGTAQSMQEVTLGRNLGPHDDIQNNCVTYCATILKAGGIDIDPSMGSQNIVGQLLNSSFPRRRL